MDLFLWCWDSRMTWDDEPERIASSWAVSNQPFPYPKRAECYQQGFKRLIDYCARTGIRGIIIWGFLRESHGGVEAARELCRYACDRGVEIYPGVGLCSYGGFFFEGEHPFNLGTYLRRNPSRATHAYDAGLGKEIGPILDPSDPENHRWWRDGLEWMLETFSLGGINFEMGDHLVHPSPRAQAARAALGISCQENVQDLIVAGQALNAHALSCKPDGRFINSTYLGYGAMKGFPSLDYATRLPPDSLWMYNMGGEVQREDFPECFAGGTPHRRAAYLHWARAGSNNAERDYTELFPKAMKGLVSLSFDMAGIYGEVSARRSPAADRNYRVMVESAMP